MWELLVGLGLIGFGGYNFFSAYQGEPMGGPAALFKNSAAIIGGLLFCVTWLIPDKKTEEKVEAKPVEETKTEIPVVDVIKPVEIEVPKIEEIKVETKVVDKSTYTATEVEMKDLACLIHLRERLSEAGNKEGLDLCAQLNGIFFQLKVKKVTDDATPEKSPA